jgi:hypothetical protein
MSEPTGGGRRGHKPNHKLRKKRKKHNNKSCVHHWVPIALSLIYFPLSKRHRGRHASGRGDDAEGRSKDASGSTKQVGGRRARNDAMRGLCAGAEGQHTLEAEVARRPCHDIVVLTDPSGPYVAVTTMAHEEELGHGRFGDIHHHDDM